MPWDLIRGLCCDLCLFCRKILLSMLCIDRLLLFRRKENVYKVEGNYSLLGNCVKLGRISRSRKGFNGVEKEGKKI